MSTINNNRKEEEVPSNFGCNICLELARDPIVTLCGHLFCWPCIYKWLHFHSQSNHCPVCNALVKEESLVPLYGMGKPSSDPRSKPIDHGVTVPSRPSAPRVVETARPRPRPEQRHHGSGPVGGVSAFGSMPCGLRFGNTLL